MEANQHVWQTMLQLISVEQDLSKSRKGQTVQDHRLRLTQHNNRFLRTNPFQVESVNQNIIHDILLFVSGLPLGGSSVNNLPISPTRWNLPSTNGCGMLTSEDLKMNEGCEKLFYYNQTMISTHRDKTRVGTISLAWTLSGMERSLSFVGREVRE